MKFTGAIITTLASVLIAQAAADEATQSERPFGKGDIVRLVVEGRKAYLIRPTITVDPTRRWIWVTPGYLALPDARGVVEHRMYVDRFLGAGFHIAGIDVGATCGSPQGAENLPKVLHSPDND